MEHEGRWRTSRVWRLNPNVRGARTLRVPQLVRGLKLLENLLRRVGNALRTGDRPRSGKPRPPLAGLQRGVLPLKNPAA